MIFCSSSRKSIPSYPCRQGFVPLAPEDFGDGGAYPEIHVVQYPLGMGKPGQKSSALVPVRVDESGTVKTDALVKQGSNKNKIVQSQISDIKEKRLTRDEIALPNEQEELETAERTRRALEAKLEGKIAAAKPTTIASTDAVEPTYMRYTPNPNAPGFNPAVSQRVIKMVEAQVDPLEPPKHKQMKVPKGPPTPPVPVMHSPTRKLTVADQQAWKIPPCISNWKNARGFIIPLDKRLAADGRGLQEVTINNKFAVLAESLYVAERKAVEDLNVRNELRKKIALREKEEQEQSLREMANRARLERSGLGGAAGRDALERRSERFAEDAPRPDVDDFDENDEEEDIEGFTEETEDEKIARQQRERLRIERRKEHERELRLANMKGNLRKNKMLRDEERDVTEQIALGMLKGTGKLSGEAAFDSRLFNQSSGMDAGFGHEDEYNTYSRPLFDRGEAASIYRPKKTDDELYGDADSQLKKLQDTSRFRPDKGFKGADMSAGPRNAPVQFEKGESFDPYSRQPGDGQDREDAASPPRRRADSDAEAPQRRSASPPRRAARDSRSPSPRQRSPPRRESDTRHRPAGESDRRGRSRSSSDDDSAAKYRTSRRRARSRSSSSSASRGRRSSNARHRDRSGERDRRPDDRTSKRRRYDSDSD